MPFQIKIGQHHKGRFPAIHKPPNEGGRTPQCTTLAPPRSEYRTCDKSTQWKNVHESKIHTSI